MAKKPAKKELDRREFILLGPVAIPWFGVAWAAFTGAVGLLGTGLLLSWFFTDHVFWALNENAFQANPISLVLAGVLLREALKGNGHREGIRARIRVVCEYVTARGVVLGDLAAIVVGDHRPIGNTQNKAFVVRGAARIGGRDGHTVGTVAIRALL